jgi:hypothetical protein
VTPPTGPRKALREALGSDDLEWARGKAWAFQQSMGLVWYYADSNPAMAGVGRRTLDRLIADERPLPAPGEDAARSRLGRASVDPHRSGPEQSTGCWPP